MLRRRVRQREGETQEWISYGVGKVDIFLVGYFFNKQIDLQQTKGYGFSHLISPVSGVILKGLII